MDVRQFAPGLWRWTAEHPDWAPGKTWGQTVGCVYYEPPAGDAIVLFDPLVPAGDDAERRFWEALDRDVARLGLPVAVLLGNRYHVRSAQTVLERYRDRVGASILVHVDARDRVDCDVTRAFREGDRLPGGVEAHLLSGLDDPEVVFHLAPHRALVFADGLLGAGDGVVRVPPESWAVQTDEGIARYRQEYRDSLRPVAALGAEMLLVSHGEPVARDGARALAEALQAPAWAGGAA